MFPPCTRRQISAAISQIKYLWENTHAIEKAGEGLLLCCWSGLRASPSVCKGSHCLVSLPCWLVFSCCSCVIMGTENKPSRGASFGEGGADFSTKEAPVNKRETHLFYPSICIINAGFPVRGALKLKRKSSHYLESS